MRWSTLVDQYLSERRQLGYALTSEGRTLYNFAKHAEQHKAIMPLNLELACYWARSAPSGSEIAIARRLTTLRPFSRFLQTIDPRSPIIPSHMVGRTHRRLAPYIYSHKEIQACLDAAKRLPPAFGISSLTLYTYIGLLVSTGLRPGEASRLLVTDISLDEGTLVVKKSKGWSCRIVPLDQTVIEKLVAYSIIRELFAPIKKENHFFLMDSGKGLDTENADNAFKTIRQQAGLSRKNDGNFPRLYDFRHTFVCNRIITWYQSGKNINQLIKMLSVYLGHKKITDTYWYITATPQIMDFITKSFPECCLGGEI